MESPSLRVYGPIADLLFIQHLYAMFCFLCQSSIVETSSTGKLASGKVIVYPQILFYTMQLYDLEPIFDLIYLNSFKTILLNVGTFFDVVALSYFVMSAGSYHLSGLVLNLGKYTLAEQTLFRNMLLNSFGIETTLQSRGRVYVNSKNKVKLYILIHPYLHSSRQYLFTKATPSKKG